MYKVTPNPPETSGSKSEKTKLRDAAQRAIDHYLKAAETKASTNEKNHFSLFTVSANVETEALLSNAYETLQSANAMALDLSENINGKDRSLVLAMQQLLELGLLLVDRALDRECPVA